MPRTARQKTETPSQAANRLVRETIEILRANGWVAYRFSNQPTAHKVGGRLVGYRKLGNPRGIPDVVSVSPWGLSVWWECKHGSGRLSPDQRDRFAELAANKAHAIEVRHVGDVARAIEDLKVYCVIRT